MQTLTHARPRARRDLRYEYRTAQADDWDDIVVLLSEAFNEEVGKEWSATNRRIFEPDRTLLATTPSGELAGTSSAYTRNLITPGGSVAAAHLTGIAVSGAHRRRGILRAMMPVLHRDAYRRREPVCVLCASEGRIYQRFGYGQAAARLIMDIDVRDVSLPSAAPHDTGVIRRGRPDDLDPLVQVFDRVRNDRPGWSTRDSRWWAHLTADVKEDRHGATALRVALHEGADGFDGYLLWQVRADPNATPPGTVIVRELVATNPDAYRALWRHALSVDLTRRASVSFAAVDEPLLHLVDEPRALRARVCDALWLRILSVPSALQARRYATPIDLVLEVGDADIAANDGRWRLVGGPDRAHCTNTDAPADVRLDIATLAAAYLGGTSLAALAAAGRVEELSRGALAAVSAALRWHREPSTVEDF